MSDETKNQELELEVEAGSGVERRRFLRNAAIAGVTAAWSAPLVSTVAYATGNHHPPPPTSPFTPGECKPDDRTTTGDTPKTQTKGSNDKKHSNDTDSKHSRDTKNSGNPWDWSEDKTDSKDDWHW